MNHKAFKEKLAEYCDSREETKKLEKRIERLDKQEELVADVVQNGYKGHAVIRGYDYIRARKLNKLKRILQERHNKLLNEQTEIELFISSIEKSDIRQIFEHRYIDDMSWIEIQIAMGYKHEDTARNKHDKFLKNITKNPF